MIVVGVDPGSNIAGLAVLDGTSFPQVKPRLLALDYYSSKKSSNFEDKLFEICSEIKKALLEFKPDALVVEEAFTGANVQSALRLAEVRGAVIYLSRELKIPVFSVPARLVKKRITGNGNASKESVAQFLVSEFSLAGKDIPVDATDALAIAYSYLAGTDVDKKIEGARV